jgi:hypothetical protein
MSRCHLSPLHRPKRSRLWLRTSGTRPIAWVDDVITREAVTWAESRSAPTLLVQTDPRLGLQRHHVDRLLTWGRSDDSP